MSRLPRIAKLETASGRAALATRKEPYWRQIHRGLYVGYYRGETSGSWYIRTQTGAIKHSRRIGIADDYADADGANILSYAQAVNLAMKGDIDDLAATKAQGAYTVAECIAHYLQKQEAKGKPVRDAELKLRHNVLPQFGSRAVASLKKPELEKWLYGLAKGRAKATANRIWSAFRAALNRAYIDDLVDTDKGWRKVEAFQNVEKPIERFLTQAEAKRLLNASQGDFRALVRGALLTGCRYGELCALEARDFNPEAATLTVRMSKSGKARHIPLTDEGCAWFSEWTAGKARDELIFTKVGEPWATSYQIRRMKEACTQAKIKPAVSFHVLRHSYASMLVSKGAPLQVVAKALGHADTRMTEKHYAHLAPNYVSETIRKNLPSFGKASGKIRRLENAG